MARIGDPVRGRREKSTLIEGTNQPIGMSEDHLAEEHFWGHILWKPLWGEFISNPKR
jgi:hypothetical protein